MTRREWSCGAMALGQARPQAKRAERVRKAAREGNLKLVIDQGQEELHDLAADELEARDLLA